MEEEGAWMVCQRDSMVRIFRFWPPVLLPAYSSNARPLCPTPGRVLPSYVFGAQ